MLFAPSCPPLSNGGRIERIQRVRSHHNYLVAVFVTISIGIGV